MFAQQTVAWRAMHSQGRGLFSVLLKNLPDIDSRTVREAEVVCNTLIGFNFGDGHLHNEDLIEAVQDEAQFEPGELIVVWVESQPIQTQGAGIQGDRCGAGRDRAWHLERGGHDQRTAVAAQRPDPVERDVDTCGELETGSQVARRAGASVDSRRRASSSVSSFLQNVNRTR